MDDVIPVPLKSTLERVCRKFFNRDAAHKSPKHQRFVELYQTTFEKDFEVCMCCLHRKKRSELCPVPPRVRVRTFISTVRGVFSVLTG